MMQDRDNKQDYFILGDDLEKQLRDFITADYEALQGIELINELPTE